MSTTKRKGASLRQLKRDAEARRLRLIGAQRVAQNTFIESWKGLPERLGQTIALAQKLGFTVEVRAVDGNLHFDAVKRVSA